VKTLTLRLAKGVAIVVTLGFVASCGLPSSGPNKSQIFSGSVLEQGDSFILTVDDRVNAIASVTPALGFAIISEKLSDQTPDPQVQVRRLAGDGATRCQHPP